MRFEFFISSKYLKKRRSNLFISQMSMISIVMVILFVAIPILTSSVANGFQLNIIDKVLTFDFHIRIEDPARTFINSSQVVEKLKTYKKIKGSYPYFEEKALIKKYGNNLLANMRGVNKKDINKNIFGQNFRKIEGSLKLTGDNQIIIAESLANNLFVRSGDSVSVAVINSSDSSSPFNTIKLKVVGIFTAGYARYDSFLAYTTLNTMRRLTSSNMELVTTVGIYLKNKEEAKSVIQELKKDSLLKNLRITDSMDNDIFNEFKKEKKLISLILYVAILISFLNIYITLNVIVVEKQKDIAILKSYGVGSKSIQKIFISQGFLIGLTGAFFGIILGLFLTINIKEISQFIEFLVNSLSKLWSFALGSPPPPAFEIMPREKFYLSTLPYKISTLDIVIQSGGAILSSLLAAYFPSRRAAKKRPVEVLRYE